VIVIVRDIVDGTPAGDAEPGQVTVGLVITTSDPEKLKGLMTTLPAAVTVGLS